MKVADALGTNENLDAFYTLQPLNSVLKLIGLNCIYRDGTVLQYDMSVCKITFLILLFSGLSVITIFAKLYIWNGIMTFTFQDTVQMIFIVGYFQYLVDLYYVHKYGRDHLLKYFRIYEHLDSVLGKIYFREIRRSIVYLITSFSAICIITCVIELSAWFLNYGVSFILANFIDCIYVLTRNFGVADFIAQVTQVLYRLKRIGDLLKGYHSLNETAADVKDIINEKNGIRKVWKKTRHIVPIKTIDYYEFVIEKLSGCYLLILKQCDYVNAMYGVRILLLSLNNLLDMVTIVNIALRIVLGFGEIQYSVFTVFASILRLLACILLPACEAYRCEQNYKQIKRIIRYIDYLLITKKISFDAKRNLRNLRALIISRPVQFHALNFYKVDYTLLLSLGSAVVTYTMILLQHME